MSAQAVVGRDVELGRISAFLAGVDGGGEALVLSGAPGIGKTVLWERGVEEAASRGLRVLAHRAVEAEAGLAFTGLAELGAIGLALMDALRVLANSARVIVAVDDIQWLDSSTAGVLPLALRRLDDAPVATLATLRVGPEAELFLSEGTVERHLTNAYRKLGVRSRSELAGRFNREPEQARHGG